jgi:hypothetical protein
LGDKWSRTAEGAEQQEKILTAENDRTQLVPVLEVKGSLDRMQMRSKMEDE